MISPMVGLVGDSSLAIQKKKEKLPLEELR